MHPCCPHASAYQPPGTVVGRSTSGTARPSNILAVPCQNPINKSELERTAAGGIADHIPAGIQHRTSKHRSIEHRQTILQTPLPCGILVFCFFLRSALVSGLLLRVASCELSSFVPHWYSLYRLRGAPSGTPTAASASIWQSPVPWDLLQPGSGSQKRWKCPEFRSAAQLLPSRASSLPPSSCFNASANTRPLGRLLPASTSRHCLPSSSHFDPGCFYLARSSSLT